MAENRHQVSTPRLVLALALLTIVGGALVFLHSSIRLGSARAAAATHGEEVHLATRVFVDWLAADAVDRKLDAMALRRVALLEVARAQRAQGLALLSLVIGLLLLLLANTAQSLREGVVRLPDKSIEKESAMAPAPKPADRRAPKLGRASLASRLELLRQPSG